MFATPGQSLQLRARDVVAAGGFEWTAAWRRRRLKGTIAVGMIPVLGAVLIAILKSLGFVQALAVDILPFILGIGYLQILLIVIPLLQGTNLIAREAEARTLTFLLVRPLSRASLLIGKFLGSWAISMTLLCVSFVVTMTILLGHDRFFDAQTSLRLLPGILVLLCVGSLAYGALFTLIGLVARRPALVGLFLAFGWETVIPFLPGAIRNFTVRHHLIGLLPDSAIPNSVTMTLDPPSAPVALVWLLLGSVLWLVLSAWIFARRDYA